MTINEVSQFTPVEASEYIKLALSSLKKIGFTQAEIGNQIGIKNLAKFKDFKTYGSKTKDTISGRKPQNVLISLIKTYNLFYNKEGNYFEIKNATQNSNTDYYNVYFESSFHNLAQGIMEITNQKSVRFILTKKTGKNIWTGRYSSTGSNTFITLEKQTGIPLMLFISVYTGNIQKPIPIYLGTYSSCKSNGKPSAGKIVLHKASNEQEALKRMDNSISPELTGFLLDSHILSPNKMITEINELPFHKEMKFLSGKYKMYYLGYDNQIETAELDIEKSQLCYLEINEFVKYEGVAQISDEGVLYLKLKKTNRASDYRRELYCQIKLTLGSLKKFPVLSGVGVGSDQDLKPIATPLLIIRDKFFKDEEVEYYKKSYFEKCQGKRIEVLSFYEIFNMKKELEKGKID